MSLAYNLVNSLAETESNEDLTTLVIDHYTRTIQIPKGITTLGVESDDEVLRLKFKMPRYLGTVDLYNFSIRINYINAQGEDDVYKVTDKAIIGDNITFSWLVGPTATAYKGNTKFNVCMVITDSDSVIQKEYNTAIASLPVLEGMECSERVVSEYTDILEQWEHRLFGIGDTEETNIVAVSEQAQAAIANKGAEVLASIPAEYTATFKMAEESVRTKADAIICSAEGDVITVTDSSDDYMRGLKIFGKTTQVKTTGKQLAEININVADYALKGVMCSATDDGNIVVSGTSTEGLWNRLISVDLVAGETYTLSSNGALILTVWDATADTDVITKERNVASITFTANNTGKHTVVLCNPAHSVFSSVRADIMVNSGSVALPWEPYSAGMVSPRPEYPQDLFSVENIDCAVYGANLFSLREVTAVGVTGIPQADGSVRYTGTADTNAWHAYQECIIPADGTYTLSVETVGKTQKGSLIQIYDDKGLVGRSWQNVENNFSCTFDTVTGAKVRWSIGVLPDESVNTTVKLMLNPGAVASPWEPYAGVQSIVAPYTLHGIPVTSGGNYADANGQRWICDEVDFERGVYVRRVAKVVLDGSVPCTVITTGGENAVKSFNFGISPFSSTSSYGIATTGNYCRHFVIDSLGYGITYAYGYRIRFENMNPDNNTIEECMEMVTNKPITVIHNLPTPIETPLTADELAAFQALKTNYLNTTVLNDAGAWMSLRYNADTETWINNLIDEKIAAAVAKLN